MISERWPSGLRRTLGKRVKGQLFRGFESHSLRQIYYFILYIFFIKGVEGSMNFSSFLYLL